MLTADVPPNQTVYVNNLNEKIKKDELKKSLYHVFSQFGNILEIHANKTLALRGQAWIVFDDLAGATKAIREMNGFNFYNKPMRVTFAKVKSDVISKQDGTFQPRPKRKADSKKAPPPSSKKPKKSKGPAFAPPKSGVGPDQTAPNKILFLENLPPDTQEMMLTMLFQQYGGFKEARLVQGKPGIAFVEFEDAVLAQRARDFLQGFQISHGFPMKISFAKQ